MREGAIARQQGAVTILLAGMMGFTLLFGLFILILADGLSQHDLLQDAAETLARPALHNQISYRRLENPNTGALLSELAADADLAGQLRSPTITYVFGNSDGNNFEPINDPDPDPMVTDFNAVALQLSSPLASFGVGAELGEITGRYIYHIPALVEKECLCDAQCPGGLLSGLLCHLSCAVNPLLSDLLGLDLEGLLDTLTCLGEGGAMVLEGAWDWLFPPNSGVVEVN